MKPRLITLLVAALLSATAAPSQESSAPASPPPKPAKPDFSRDNLLRLLVDAERPDHDRNVRFHVGAIEFKALGQRWRYNYLPLMMPLSGSIFRTTQEWPDPFALSGTTIASPPRTWPQRRAVERELRWVNLSTKAKAKVKVKVETGGQ